MSTTLSTPRPPSERLHPLIDPLPAAQVRVKGGPSCPLCLEPITALPRLEVCPGCQSIHHWSCVVEMRRCGTIGCTGLSHAPAPESDSRALAAVAFAGNVVGGAVLVPLVLWLLGRHRRDPFLRYHARQALLLSLAASVLAIPTFGLAVLAMVVVSLIAAVRTWRGEWWRLPVVGARPPAEAALPPATPRVGSGKP